MKQSILFVLLLIAAPFAPRAQTMRMTPDSGYQGQNLAVTIVGTGTQFSSTNNASEVQVFLEHSGIIVDGAYSEYIVNDSTVQASFEIGASMLGSYDLVVKITDTSTHTFTQDSAFRVTPAPASITSVARLMPSTRLSRTP